MRYVLPAVLSALGAAAILSACGGGSGITASAPAAKKKVIIFVWDGLRPDSVTAAATPNLAALRDRQGVNFTDNHAVFPSFTMMNASAFATGAYPGTHGFYGNTLYQPGPAGKDSSAAKIDFVDPVFTEDYGVINALNTFYENKLYLIGSLFQAAQAAGLTTATIGKSGAAFIQDYADYAADAKNGNGRGIILDEKMAFPLSFAKDLQAAGYRLPKLSVINYSGDLALSPANGDPTAANVAITRLKDGIASDPRSKSASPFNDANAYMMDTYLNYVLPKKDPDLSVVWFRNPDSTEHAYGPGTGPYLSALASQDKMLGQLMDKIKALGIQDRTNIIVVSDHGHTTVAGDPAYFPLRGLTGAADGSGDIGAIDPNGYSVSGDVKTADLLTRAGIAHVYDGSLGCAVEPVMSGIKSDGTRVYPLLTDTDGSICKKGAGFQYSTRAYPVPAAVPADATIIAANGGADYLYLPDHNPARLARIVAELQKRPQYGAIFVASRYGAVPGTLPMTIIKTEGNNANARFPDIMVSFNFDDNGMTAANAGLPGTEYESFGNNRGMHGTFGMRDVHNTLIAGGPDFTAGYADACPSGNVDVAPTAARILGLSLPNADGRALLEAIKGSGKACSTANIAAKTLPSSTVAGLTILDPRDPSGAMTVPGSRYQFTLFMKELSAPDGKTYTYFDQAKAVRN